MTPMPLLEARQPQPEGEVKKKVRVKLRDGKERTIRHISVTTFWGQDGKPISAAEFLTLLFGQLPEFFRDEDELRALWSLPDTRKKLLEGLAEKGFGKDQLKYHDSIPDSVADLGGDIAQIRNLFAGFQRYLYQGVAA